jgi:hypothetical protein
MIPEVTDQAAVKFDNGKVDWSLVPFEALEGMVRVLEFGANKYAAHNWRQGGGFKFTRLINSLLRHVFAFARGEDLDPESGLSHIWHAQCNLLFLAMYIKDPKTFTGEDRYGKICRGLTESPTGAQPESSI